MQAHINLLHQGVYVRSPEIAFDKLQSVVRSYNMIIDHTTCEEEVFDAVYNAIGLIQQPSTAMSLGFPDKGIFKENMSRLVIMEWTQNLSFYSLR